MVGKTEVAAATLSAPPASTWAAYAPRADRDEHDAEGQARAERDQQACAEAGIALPAAMFALGTTLYQVGEDNARAERRAFEAHPPALGALQDLIDEVVAEDRRDVVAGLADLRLTDALRLERAASLDREAVSVRVEEAALRKLQSGMREAIGAGGDLGVATLAKMPALRSQAADVWNACAAELAKQERKGSERTVVTLRTRKVERAGQEQVVKAERARDEQVYAVVSETYGEVDTHKIAAGCRRLVEVTQREQPGADIRASVIYDRSRVKIDLLTHTTVAPEAQVVGDVFKGALRCKSDDTGKGALHVWVEMFRVACRNYTIVSAEGAHTVIRHVGDPARLQERLREALAAAYGVFEIFAKQWTSASRRALVDLEADVREHRGELAAMVAEITARQARDAALAEVGLSPVGQALLDGAYRSLLLGNKLVPVKEVEQEVVALRAAHWDARNNGGAQASLGGLNRAALANGLTLRAQAWPLAAAHDAEVLAGRVVSGDEVLGWIAAKSA
jgi:hypothetical protein